MLNQGAGSLLRPNLSSAQLVAAGGAGLLLGLACLRLSPLSVLGALTAILLVLTTLKRPEVALLGLVALTSSLVAEQDNPPIPIGFGTLYISDAILLSLFGLFIIRWMVEPQFRIVRTPLDLPLLAFYGVAVLSTLIAILQGSLPFHQSLEELRIVTNYLTFFVVTNLVREKRQLVLLWRGILLLAAIVAVATIVQYLLGESVTIIPGRVETLSTEGVEYSGVARIIPPGQSLILVGFVTMGVRLSQYRLSWTSLLALLHWGLVGSALLLSFNRNFWLGAGLALLLLAVLGEGRHRQRLVGWVLVSALLAATILLPLASVPDSRAANLVSASIGRLTSLGERETFQDSDSSLRWRDFEYAYALPQIASHPLLGLGLGARYRPFVLGMDHDAYDGRAYVHNGHIWILVKSGLLGYLSLMWLSLAFLLRALKYWRRIPDLEMRGWVLGFALTYLAVLLGSMVNSMLMQWFWTSVIGIMMGTNEAVIKNAVDKSRSDQPEADFHTIDNAQ